MSAAGSTHANTVTLVIADDHPPFVDGLARVLPERCAVSVAACCCDSRAALEAIHEHLPDVALLDLRIALIGPRAVLGEVVRLKLATRVLVCSERGEPPVVRALLEHGARGYLGKTSSWEEICAAVETVAGGGVWVSPQFQAGLNGQLAASKRPPSVRELEVLALASRGLTDLQIAQHMYISRETVRTNLKRCSQKLGVSGRTALVATALRQGMLE